MNLPTGRILALYNGGRWSKYTTPQMRSLLSSIQMDGYMPHAGPRGLLGTDPDKPDAGDPTELIAWLRDITPGAKIFLGVGLDGWTEYLGTHLVPDAHDPPRSTPDAEATVTKLFEAIARMSSGLQVAAVVPDAETASEQNPSAGGVMARLFLETFRRVAPAMPVIHTSFDAPIAVENPPASHHYWGGHSAYPFSAWLDGPERADAEATQNYTAAKTGLSSRGSVEARVRLSNQSFALAKRKGIVHPDMPIVRYFQVHNTNRLDLINASLDEQLVFYWALATAGSEETIDAEGVSALTAIQKMKRLGYAGVVNGARAIDRFLEEAKRRGYYSGAMDHIFGPGAEAALTKFVG